MTDIVLTTLNARYWHTAFGLRCLLANMGELTERTVIREFSIGDSLIEVASDLLEHDPQIIGIGVYIWNVRQVAELVGHLRSIDPSVVIVLGGPEVSHETEQQDVVRQADYVVTGEADLAFASLCRRLLQGDRPQERIVAAPLPDLTDLVLPYHLYTDEDIAHRVIYVEASRGCPFTCEFCLSALDVPVRQADPDAFLKAMTDLLNRGARRFKFVDRTFNLNLKTSRRILEFFLQRQTDGLFVHFEMIPDRLPEALREIIARFPPGMLQFEIGVQTFNPQVSERISRRQNLTALEDNFRFLRERTGVHIHADLIVGLPGEDLESFGRGFDRLLSLDPQEIQIGLLKRLRGTPIVRHEREFRMVYSSVPPFEILRTRDLDFREMMRLRHLARTWDLVGNSGNFPASLSLMWSQQTSCFERFLDFSDDLVRRERRLHGIPLTRLAQRLFEYLTDVCGIDPQHAAETIWKDYTRHGRSDRPEFLRRFSLPAPCPERNRRDRGLPIRQRRHRQARTEEDAEDPVHSRYGPPNG